jgi:hypothetical protein
MRKTISLIAAGVLAASFAVSIPSASAGEVVDTLPTAFFFFCRSNELVNNTFYISTTQQVASGTLRKDLEKSYRAFLAKTYKYPNDKGISCVFAVGGDLQGRTESTRRGTIESLHSSNLGVVETTDWKYAK